MTMIILFVEGSDLALGSNYDPAEMGCHSSYYSGTWNKYKCPPYTCYPGPFANSYLSLSEAGTDRMWAGTPCQKGWSSRVPFGEGPQEHSHDTSQAQQALRK